MTVPPCPAGMAAFQDRLYMSEYDDAHAVEIREECERIDCSPVVAVGRTTEFYYEVRQIEDNLLYIWTNDIPEWSPLISEYPHDETTWLDVLDLINKSETYSLCMPLDDFKKACTEWFEITMLRFLEKEKRDPVPSYEVIEF